MQKLRRIHVNSIVCMIILAIFAVTGSFSSPVNAAETANVSDVSTSNDNTISYHGTMTEREFWKQQSNEGHFFSTDIVAQTTGSTGLFKSQLTGKALEIYKALENTTLSSTNPGATITRTLAYGEDFDSIVNEYGAVYGQALFAYEYDHLDELYWQSDNGISYNINMLGNKITLKFNYNVSPYYNSSLEATAKEKIAAVAEKAKTLGTTYEKLEYLNQWICDNCIYDYAALSSSSGTKEAYYAHTAMGCLILGKGVCETYAKTLKLLCQELDIPCLVVNSATHAFNYVKMGNGKWYMIDATWNDSGDYSGNYKTYFLTSNNPYIDKKDHVVDGPLYFPYTSTNSYAVDKDTEPVIYPTTLVLSSSSYTYDGKVKTPSVIVLDNNKEKLSSKYYTVKYASGRKNVGKYNITVTFRDIYQSYGSNTLTFTINPPKTTLRSLTAKNKGFTVKWDKKASQVTGYQIQYSTSSNFKNGTKTITVGSYKTVSKTISKLKAKKKYYVRIRTYKNISGSSRLYSGWSAAKSVKTK